MKPPFFKRTLLALLLALAMCAARAEWIRVGATEQANFYIDSELKNRAGSHVVIWALRDFPYSHLGAGGYFLSSKDELEIDCANQRLRRIFTSDHPRHMGGGDFVYSEHGPMSWNKVPTDSIMQRLVDVACLRFLSQ